MRQLLPEANYLRLNPTIDREFSKLDDTSLEARRAWLAAVRDKIEEEPKIKEKVESLLEFLKPEVKVDITLD